MRFPQTAFFAAKALFCASFLVFCLFLLLAGGCVRGKAGEEALGRPQRGYVHWLEQQAMHNQARKLLAEVSQSERMWLNSAAPGGYETLLAAAPSWLLAGNHFPAPVFSSLAKAIPRLAARGIGGIYLGQTGEAAELWLESGDGGVASLAFAPNMGDDKSFEKLAQTAEAAGLQVGSDLLGGATGFGPDFILQSRNAPGSAGIYAMLEAPESLWNILPPASKEWDCQPLSPQAREALAEEGALPAAIARDAWEWASPGGWAATGEIRGIDGKIRRWLYRYSKTPASPVLMWPDPFGQARRILSACAIRQTGLQGQALTGLRFEALLGLEPPDSQNPENVSLNPGLDAINDLASQIHRYGGWAIQADAIPEEAIAKILQGECDFCHDAPAEIIALAALASQNSRLLNDLYARRISRGLDFRRLARGLNSETPAKNIAGVKIAEILQKLPGKTPLLTEKWREFLHAFRIGQPGLVFLDPGALLEQAAPLLEARKAAGLAEGELVQAIPGAKKTLGLLTKLPDGGYWLLAMNLGEQPEGFSIRLPQAANGVRVFPETKKHSLEGRNFNLALDGTQCVNVVFSVK